MSRRDAWLLAAPVAAGMTVLGVAALAGGGWIAPPLPPSGFTAPTPQQVRSAALVPPPEQPAPAPRGRATTMDGHDLPPPWTIDADGRVHWKAD